MPRAAIRHRIETAECLEDRLYWAMVLWSWCGPEKSPYVVLKNSRGYIRRDGGDNPIPAKAKDLLELLGLGPSMAGNVSRAIHRLVAKNCVRYEKRILYPVKEPEPLPVGIPPKNCSTATFFIAGETVSTDNFAGLDEEKKREAVQWLEQLSTEWRDGLQQLKYRLKSLLDEGLSARGIIIDKKSRRVEEIPSSSDSPELEEVTTTETPPTAQDETPTVPAIQNPPVESNTALTHVTEVIPATDAVPESRRRVLVTDELFVARTLGIDQDAAKRMIRDTRAVRPDATSQEIVRAAFWKVKQLRGLAEKGSIGNLVGLLIRAIPKMAASDQWLQIRAELARDALFIGKPLFKNTS